MNRTNGNRSSAQVVVAYLCQNLSIRSVVDFGCAQGAWLAEWQSHEIEEVIGLDGDYVDTENLFIPTNRFRTADLSQKIDLGRQFDLVQSLEVAEHIDASCAQVFVENLVRHGPVVLFAAAPPGQGGEHHVNERPYSYWRTLFAQHGYVAIDYVRPFLLGNSDEVQPWYRYNIFLYVEQTKLAQLPSEITDAMVNEAVDLKDISPISYKLRKSILRLLPYSAINLAARIRTQIFL